MSVCTDRVAIGLMQWPLTLTINDSVNPVRTGPEVISRGGALHVRGRLFYVLLASGSHLFGACGFVGTLLAKRLARQWIQIPRTFLVVFAQISYIFCVNGRSDPEVDAVPLSWSMEKCAQQCSTVDDMLSRTVLGCFLNVAHETSSTVDTCRTVLCFWTCAPTSSSHAELCTSVDARVHGT